MHQFNSISPGFPRVLLPTVSDILWTKSSNPADKSASAPVGQVHSSCIPTDYDLKQTPTSPTHSSTNLDSSTNAISLAVRTAPIHKSVIDSAFTQSQRAVGRRKNLITELLEPSIHGLPDITLTNRPRRSRFRQPSDKYGVPQLDSSFSKINNQQSTSPQTRNIKPLCLVQQQEEYPSKFLVSSNAYYQPIFSDEFRSSMSENDHISFRNIFMTLNREKGTEHIVPSQVDDISHFMKPVSQEQIEVPSWRIRSLDEVIASLADTTAFPELRLEPHAPKLRSQVRSQNGLSLVRRMNRIDK
ncbi:unnamed protein product, partial [Protopolystoma xenopodis]